MSSKAICIRETLYSAIRSVSAVMVVCAFSRQRFYQECQVALCKVDYPDSVLERQQYHL